MLFRSGKKIEDELPLKVIDPAFVAVAYAELCVRTSLTHITAVYPAFENNSHVEL